MFIRARCASPDAGFSYVETLLALILLMILLVPAMNALSSALQGSATSVPERALSLREKMEDVLSRPYSELYAATSISDTTSTIKTAYSDPAGTANRRVVVFYRCTTTTAHALTTSNTGMLRVKVYFEADGSNNALETLVGRWW